MTEEKKYGPSPDTVYPKEGFRSHRVFATNKVVELECREDNRKYS